MPGSRQRVQPAFLLVSLNPQHAGQSVLRFSSLVEVEELRTVEGSPVLSLQWAAPHYSLGNAHPGCFLICEADLVVPLCKVIVRIAEFYYRNYTVSTQPTEPSCRTSRR